MFFFVEYLDYLTITLLAILCTGNELLRIMRRIQNLLMGHQAPAIYPPQPAAPENLHPQALQPTEHQPVLRSTTRIRRKPNRLNL